MVYSLLIGSTLLRVQRSRFPQTFCRYKSFIAALEKGKQGEPDRPSNPRTKHDPPKFRKNRRELRQERFGPTPSSVRRTALQHSRKESREEISDERVGSPRSSRFGRVVPARGHDDVPSRFREEGPTSDRDDRPRHREGAPDAAPDGARDRGSRFDRERRSSNRYDGEKKPLDQYGGERNSSRYGGERTSTDRYGGDRKPSDRFGGVREPSDRFGGGRKPSDRFGGDRKPPGRFGGDPSPSDRFGGDRSSPDRFGRDRKPAYRSEDRESRREQSGESEDIPFRQEKAPYTRDARPLDWDTGSERPRSSYSARAVSRGPPRDETGSDRDRVRSARPERSFKSGRTPYVHARGSTGDRFKDPRFARPESQGSRRGQERSERYPHDTGRNHHDMPSRNTSESVPPKSTASDIESLPYTTAASEFIYGHSSVLAAIKANRRKLYSIYVHPRGANREGLLARIRKEKLFPITKEVGDEYMRAMDKASSGRPHNGVILESSPLPVPPITELKTSSLEDESFGVTVDTQSAEDALVNGKKELYSYQSGGWRHPLILYVDGVLDEGNLGAIARSAYFLGVDAIVTPTRQVAPWSHITLKASAGAAEALPLFKVGEPADFLGKSSRAGWRIYASSSVPPPPAPSVSASTTDAVDEDSSDVVYTLARSNKRLPTDHSPVAEHPTILMMGAEGAGLRPGLLNQAHYNVGIRHGRDVDEIGVDSLNVSVAASLLCYKMLLKPKAKPVAETEGTLF